MEKVQEKVCLYARGLMKSYGDRLVVNNVELKVETAEVVGLLGPNGAGKTTSFYMVVGLIRPDEGKIFLGDQELTQMPIHQRAHLGIGYLPQEACVFRDLSVEDNVYSVLECRSLSSLRRKELLEGLLQEFGITHIRKSFGRDLSGGERRRVEIARTLALEPKFVLLDEPFAGVDPLAVHDIKDVIEKLRKKNIGVLITDHNVRETLGIVGRAYIMNKGELLVSGTPQEIVADERAKKFYLGEGFTIN